MGLNPQPTFVLIGNEGVGPIEDLTVASEVQSQ